MKRQAADTATSTLLVPGDHGTLLSAFVAYRAQKRGAIKAAFEAANLHRAGTRTTRIARRAKKARR